MAITESGATVDSTAEPLPPSRRRPIAGVLLATVSVLTLAVVFGAVVVSQKSEPEPPAAGAGLKEVQLRDVRVAASLRFFDDPAVRAVMARNKLRIVRTELPSAEVGRRLDDYDVVVSTIADTGGIVESRLGPTAPLRRRITSSPLVIASFPEIAELLMTIGIVTRKADGSMEFLVDKYIAICNRKQFWDEIPGNTTYPRTTQVALSLTSLKSSGSAKLFMALASAGFNGGVVMSNSARIGDFAKTIAPCLGNLGQQETSTTDLRNMYKDIGMDSVPIGLMYENDFIQAKLGSEPAKAARMIALYPKQNLLTSNYLYPLNPIGEEFAKALVEAKELVEVAQLKYGYRAAASDSSAQFTELMKGKGIAVPVSLNYVPEPTSAILDEIAKAVVKELPR